MVKDGLLTGMRKSLLEGSENNPQFSIEITIKGREESFKADFIVRANNSLKLRMVTLVLNPKVYVRGRELSVTCLPKEFEKVADEVIIRGNGGRRREWGNYKFGVEFIVECKFNGERFEGKAVLRDSSTQLAQCA